MANSKEIELAIKARDLASKPLQEIGAAVDALVSAVAELAPASEKGAKNFQELSTTASQLQKAMQGLKADASLVETFTALAAKVEAASNNLKVLREQADAAKIALSNTAEPTKQMAKDADAFTSAANRQEKSLGTMVTRLDLLKAKMTGAGIDFTNLAAAQAQIDTAFNAAAPAYAKVNGALDQYAANQRKAAVAAQEAAAIEKAAAADQAAALARLASANALQTRRKQGDEGAAAAEAAEFKKAVFAQEALRAKDVALAFAEQEAAAAMLKKTAAAELEAKAEADLAAKTQAQANAVREATAMEQRFTESMRQHAGATGEAATQHNSLLHSFSLFRDEGRTTLSLYQRLRGEILSMTAEFVGFYGAIEAVKSGFESIEKLEGTKSILSQTFGAEGAGQQLDYVKGQAERLSLTYVDLARNYAKFAAAAAGSGTDQNATRQIFETFAEAARVKNLTAEQQTTIFGALDKIFAKDTVGATELFRKLSTDLPEAAAIFRKSIDTLDGKPLTTDEFERLLKSGKITAAFVQKFAADYRASFAEQLPEATHSTTAALVGFGNAWDQFKRDILEGGALDAFKDALLKMTAFFKSEDGRTFAHQMSEGLQLIAKGFGLVVDHIGELELALGVLATLWAANIAKSFYADLVKLASGFQALAATINASFIGAGALKGAIGGAFGIVGTFFAAYNFGTWLYNQSGGVRQFGAILIGSFEIMFQKIGDLASLMWAKVFHPKDVDALKASQEKAMAASMALFKENIKSAGEPQDGGPSVGADGKPVTAPGATSTAITPEQKAAASLAARKALDEELFTAAKSLQTKLSEMRGSLLKKDATDLAGYLKGVQEQFKPLYADIDKLKQDFPHNSEALVAKLTAQLNSIKALTLTDAGNKFNEDKAKKDLQEINDLLRHRDNLIQNETRKVSEGVEGPETATKNIAGISNSANVGILANVQKLQQFISALPGDVQTKLSQTSEELKLVLDKLTERPASNVLKEIKSQEEDINQALQVRDARMAAIAAEQKAGLITHVQEKAELKAINDEYAKTIQAAKDLIVFIQTSNTLNDDQRKGLDSTITKLRIIIASAKQVNVALYPAANVAQDIARGAVGIAEAFAKAAGQGQSLGKSFHAAWQAFKSFASDFLLNIGKMILQQTVLNALGYGTGGKGGGIPSGISGLIGGLFGGGAASGAATGAASSGIAASNADAVVAGLLHSGGYVSPGAGIARTISSAHFQNAQRFHSGGMVGLDPGEVPAILQTGEKVLSRAQVAAGNSQSPQHIQVINAIDHEDVVRQGLAAPSNHRVILNMIRANRASVRQALA